MLEGLGILGILGTMGILLSTQIASYTQFTHCTRYTQVLFAHCFSIFSLNPPCPLSKSPFAEHPEKDCIQLNCIQFNLRSKVGILNAFDAGRLLPTRAMVLDRRKNIPAQSMQGHTMRVVLVIEC